MFFGFRYRKYLFKNLENMQLGIIENNVRKIFIICIRYKKYLKVQKIFFGKEKIGLLLSFFYNK